MPLAKDAEHGATHVRTRARESLKLCGSKAARVVLPVSHLASADRIQ
jgi:hypothetical protein